MTQEEFDQQFMTTKEIAIFLGITVQGVWYARERGTLPKGITIKHSKAVVWPREEIMEKLKAWKTYREKEDS